MNQSLSIEIIAVESSKWPQILADIRARLESPRNPLLFPPHFLQSVFPKIGGIAIEVKREGVVMAYAFLFPRLPRNCRHAFTVRLHLVPGFKELDREGFLAKLAESLPDSDLVAYDPRLLQIYEREEFLPRGAISYGRPDEREAVAARRIQKEVWEAADDDLYPSDLYSTGFGAGTSLVARDGSSVIGFLFGFYKLGGPSLPRAWSQYEGSLRIESQVAGVDERYQGMGVGPLLKKFQAEQALRDRISIINWTVDPLRGPSATVNFGKLRAVSFRFLPDYYSFRNKQNRLRASRLEITWLLPSARVQKALVKEELKAEPLSIEFDREVAILNDEFRIIPFDDSSPWIAIEIPKNWGVLQDQYPAEAKRWRDTTDALLQDRLGPNDGQYMITDVLQRDRRWYLMGHRIDPDFPGEDSDF